MIEERGDGPLAERDPRGSFSGDLSEVPLADVFQTLELGRRTGTLHVRSRTGREATLWFRDGRVVDAERGAAAGEGAVQRMLRWSEGEFSAQFGPVTREQRIAASHAGLLMEAARRADAWRRLAAELPPVQAVLQLDYRLLSERLAEIPDDVNGVLKLVDGRRSLAEIVDDAPGDDLAAGAILARLCSEGLVRVAAGAPAPPIAAALAPPPGGTPDPERVTWFAGPDEGPAPRAAQPEVPPRIVRFPPRRALAPADTPLPTPALSLRDTVTPVADASAAPPRPARRRARAALLVLAALAALGLAALWATRGAPT